jgi:hypothetical protein
MDLRVRYSKIRCQKLGNLHSNVDGFKTGLLIYIPLWIDLRLDYNAIRDGKCKFTFQCG